MTKESSIQCVNAFRTFFIESSSPYRNASWYAKYSEIANSIKILSPLETTDSIELVRLCVDNATNSSKAARLSLVFDSANQTSADKEFSKKIMEIKQQRYRPVINKVAELYKCNPT